MTRASLVALLALAISGGGLVGYLTRSKPQLIAQRHTHTTVLTDPDPAPVVRPPLPTTQARLVTPSAPAPALDERSLMASLRALGPAEAQRALQVARAGNAAFPDSPEAAERAWTIAKVLTGLGQFHEARGEARQLVQRFPDSPWARDAERHLLVYPLDQPSREDQQAFDVQ